MDGFVKLAQDNTHIAVSSACSAAVLLQQHSSVLCGGGVVVVDSAESRWVSNVQGSSTACVRCWCGSGSCAQLSIVFCWAKRRYWENWRTHVAPRNAVKLAENPPAKKRDWRCNLISSGVSVLVKLTFSELQEFSHPIIILCCKNRIQNKKGKMTFYSSLSTVKT